VLSAYTLHAWSRVYPQLRGADVLTRAGRATVGRLAGLCLTERKGLAVSAALSCALGVSFVKRRPWDDEPSRSLLAVNSAGHTRTAAPVLVTQGDADPLVKPVITAAFVRRLCAGDSGGRADPARGRPPHRRPRQRAGRRGLGRGALRRGTGA
jgi:hypothetical protein